MTRIDFHTNIPDKIGYTCRLVRKARGADQKVVVYADRAQLSALDQALWTFSEQDFLPHVMAGDELASLTPVILTDAAWVEACARPDPSLAPRPFASDDAIFRVVSSSGTTG